MKYLKLFNQDAEYQQFKESEDFVLPNVSFVEETKVVKFNPYTAPTSPNVVCTYNVTDISQETNILHSYALSYVTNMIVDGIEMDADTYYQFDTVGNHVIEFVLDDPTTIGHDAFSNCSSLTTITIPDSVTTIGGSVFNGCRELSEITCNAITAPTIGSRNTFKYVKEGGVLKVPTGSDYSSWMSTSNYYLGNYNWTIEYI